MRLLERRLPHPMPATKVQLSLQLTGEARFRQTSPTLTRGAPPKVRMLERDVRAPPVKGSDPLTDEIHVR